MKNQSKKSLKKQKMYKMKGCSTKTRKLRHLGGRAGQPNLSDYNLAYPAKGVTFLPNPALAYTGKGGSSNLACTDGLTQAPLAYTGNTNTNGMNPAYPSTGPTPASQNWLNGQQTGGNCGCGVNYAVHAGGSSRSGLKHRPHCKCNQCKIKNKKGGNGLPYGQGLPPMKDMAYPNGLAGAPWRPPVANWPGVDGVSSGRNHLAYNTYSPNDVSRQMIATGANPPFSIGGAKKSRHSRKYKKGGYLSNLLGQDFVNLGRQFQYNLGSTYNALNGFPAPVSPLPWKDQIPSATTSRI
jgi:hypothetical protein